MNDLSFKRCRIIGPIKEKEKSVIIPCIADIPCENGSTFEMPLEVYTTKSIYEGDKFQKTNSIAKGIFSFSGLTVFDQKIAKLNLVTENRIEPGFTAKVLCNTINVFSGIVYHNEENGKIKYDPNMERYLCRQDASEFIGYYRISNNAEPKGIIVNYKNCQMIMIKPGCFYNTSGIVLMRGNKPIVYSDIIVKDNILNENIRIVM